MESIDDLAEKLQKNLKMAKEDEEESRGGFDLAQYKVKKCPDGEKCQKETLKCMFYHSNADRRRTSRYSASLCRFNPCRRYPDCPYAHNQYEVQYHIDNYKKRVCKHYENGFCHKDVYCPFMHQPSEDVVRIVDMIVRLKPQQRKQLQELLPQELKEEFAKGLARYSVSYRGWEEKGFSVGDKKKLKEMLTEVKALMKDSKNTERYAPMVKYADANSGKFKEDIKKEYKETKHGHVIRLAAQVMKSTNWAHHAPDGEPKFAVTPENQKEAIQTLKKLIEELHKLPIVKE